MLFYCGTACAFHIIILHLDLDYAPVICKLGLNGPEWGMGIAGTSQSSSTMFLLQLHTHQHLNLNSSAMEHQSFLLNAQSASEFDIDYITMLVGYLTRPSEKNNNSA